MTPSTAPLVVAFAGLPGSGKSTIARLVAGRLGATWIRLDTIETTLEEQVPGLREDPLGHHLVEAVAADQVRDGRPVVIDAVNAVPEARSHWVRLAGDHGADLRWVHVLCSDTTLHRARVEGRSREAAHHHVPTWEQVQARGFAPWDDVTPVTVDNLSTPEEAAAVVLAALRG